MSINLHLPTKTETLRPTITVVGVGGAGGNAVNNMVAAKLEGVNFVVANTDAQALDHSLTQKRIQLGNASTRGLGAGADPTVGKNAADEAMDDIAEAIEGSNMVFITAGMGGGTGTGAAPVVAKLAREQGILTVGVVTKPFHFEGTHRMRLAEQGLQELQQYVDTLIVIPNQNLFRIANEKTTFADAFRMADEVLHTGVRGLTDLIVKPGIVNLDFADIRTVMREMGKAMMGTGEATGERRALDAAEAAISNPLLDDVSLKGAKAVLINITGGMDMGLYEVDEAGKSHPRRSRSGSQYHFRFRLQRSDGWQDPRVGGGDRHRFGEHENAECQCPECQCPEWKYGPQAVYPFRLPCVRMQQKPWRKPQLIVTTAPAASRPAMSDFTGSTPMPTYDDNAMQNEPHYAEPVSYAGMGAAETNAGPPSQSFPGPAAFQQSQHVQRTAST